MLNERNYLLPKEYILYESVYINSRKCKIAYSDRKQISSGWGQIKGTEEIFEGER